MQQQLPRLPVPDLKETLAKYLESCKPFASAQQLSDYMEIVGDFSGSFGPVLQKRLVDYEATQEHSWLENWWLKYAYLTWRESCMVHSNWYMLAMDLCPPSYVASNYTGFTNLQISRASALTYQLLQYKLLLQAGKVKPENSKGTELCMHQYTMIFGVTRIPRDNADVLVTFPKSRHVILMIMDQFFVVHVYAKDGSVLGVDGIKSQFKNAISNIGELGPAVGLLSAQHRDHWAKDHKILEELDPENAKSFSWIESALFCVCLDHRPIPEDLNSSAKNVFHGFDARNRWFDKSISLIVTNDGRAGLNGEHSPCDALVPAFVFDYAIRNEFKSIEMGTDPEKLPFKLFWKINTQISKSINNATAYAAKCIGDSDVHVLHFADYGASFIKKSAQVSPDFYAQACLQIAFKRIHKFQTAVYETASTRIYSHARTETCRVLSNDMKAFVDCLDIDVAPKHKLEKFQAAAKTHSVLLKEASKGFGVDRHLLGLKLSMKPGETHALFTHPLFSKSQEWLLSTSALFSGERVNGTGFGAVYHNGYGVNYMIADNMIKFGIECKKSAGNSAKRFADQLTKALQDLRELNSTRSKL